MVSTPEEEIKTWISLSFIVPYLRGPIGKPPVIALCHRVKKATDTCLLYSVSVCVKE